VHETSCLGVELAPGKLQRGVVLAVGYTTSSMHSSCFLVLLDAQLRAWKLAYVAVAVRGSTAVIWHGVRLNLLVHGFILQHSIMCLPVPQRPCCGRVRILHYDVAGNVPIRLQHDSVHKESFSGRQVASPLPGQLCSKAVLNDDTTVTTSCYFQK
jgi:hypothetical protein